MSPALHVTLAVSFLTLLLPCILAQTDQADEIKVVPLHENDETTHSTRFQGFSPVTSSDCGFARITSVGISVNKGAKATLKYKIKVKAIYSHDLAFRDEIFYRSLTAVQQAHYQAHRKAYKGGLDVPFLTFLGVNLDSRHGGGAKNPDLDATSYKKLAAIALKILRKASKQKIVAKGKLKAKGVSCMRTTAYAFVKVAKVKLSDGNKLTVLSSGDDDVIAATKHADTVLPTSGGATSFGDELFTF